jgi:hypothetical protein
MRNLRMSLSREVTEAMIVDKQILLSKSVRVTARSCGLNSDQYCYS